MFKNLKLTAPIVFFDLETTGRYPESARIVELAWLKIDPDGSVVGKTYRVNPGVPIPESASSIHGIRDEDVIDSPTFDKLLCCPSTDLRISTHRLAGYNCIYYDIPIVDREMYQAKRLWERSPLPPLDVMKVLHALIPYQRNAPSRTLSWAFEKFVGRSLEGAHGAMADARASAELIDALIPVYRLPDTVEGLVEKFPIERRY
jgi:DNA polymerase-3 subunit epsilon